MVVIVYESKPFQIKYWMLNIYTPTTTPHTDNHHVFNRHMKQFLQLDRSAVPEEQAYCRGMW